MTDNDKRKAMPEKTRYVVRESTYNFYEFDEGEKLSFRRKRVLLHSCCGPCSTAAIERLLKDYDVTVFFYNPNISTQEEYDKRLEAQRTVVEYFQEESGLPGQVDLEIGGYDSEDFLAAAERFASEPEGGKRCNVCFKMRLEETARKASEGRYDYFTTTLSISPHKNFELIRTIGEEMAEKYNVSFLPEDFKKKAGFNRSVELSKRLGIYRQNFCGCLFSYRG